MLTTQMLEIAIKEAKEKFIPGAILRMYEEENLYKIDFITKEGEFICLVGATNMFEVTVTICEAIADELKVYIQNDMQVDDALSDEEDEDDDEEEDIYSERADRAAMEEDESLDTDVSDLIAKSLAIDYLKIIESKKPDSIKTKLSSCDDGKFVLEFVYSKLGKEYIELGHVFKDFRETVRACMCLIETIGIIK